MPRRSKDTDPSASQGLIDDVTGLYNARGLARRVREMGSQAFRSHQSLVCITLACDPVAKEPADDVLPIVAAAMEKTLRPSDPVGRLSGSNFVVLAVGTGEGDAQRMTTRLRLAVEKAIESRGRTQAFKVNAGFEEVANLAYAPVEPMDLLARATNALRGLRADRGD